VTGNYIYFVEVLARTTG